MYEEDETMATVFGKALRKIRINRDELLMDMAKKLEITSAYLSSIENGKRGIPQDMSKKIIKLYNLDADESKNLFTAEDESRKKVEFDFTNSNPSKKNIVLALARSFDELSDEQLQEIRNILDKRKD